MLQQIEKMMEGVEEDAPNTIELKVDSLMSREQVISKIMQELQEMSV